MSSRSEEVTPALLRELGNARSGRLEEVPRSRDGRRRIPSVARCGDARPARPRCGSAPGGWGSSYRDRSRPSSAPFLPEAAIFALPPHASDPLDDTVRSELEAADAVLVGPGFDDADATRATLLTIAQSDIRCLILDAFALGVLPDVDRHLLPADLILNPNEEEAAILLGREPAGERADDLLEIARRFDAVVNCYGVVADPQGDTWRVPEGGPGLGTSGSGDVLAGAITGFAARGMSPSRAAVWGSWTHARAGDRLTERVGIGFLARDLPAELTAAVKHVLG